MNVSTLDYPDCLFFHVFLRISAKDLVKQCSFVCKKWNFILSTRKFWLQKCKFDGQLPSVEVRRIVQDFQKFCIKNPFRKNLICGNNPAWKTEKCDKESDYDERWEFLRPDGFEYEEPPVFVEGFFHPDFDQNQIKSCLATNEFWSSKDITIDLLEEGFEPKILDEIQPSITISEYVAHRADCEAKYRLIAFLLDENMKKLNFFETELVFRQWQTQKWTKVEHQFHDYGSGIRYIYVRSDGRNLQGWAGSYGVKMANISIVVDYE